MLPSLVCESRSHIAMYIILILHLIHVSFSRFSVFLNFKLNIIILTSCTYITCAGVVLGLLPCHFSFFLCLFFLFYIRIDNLITRINCNFPWILNKKLANDELTVAIQISKMFWSIIIIITRYFVIADSSK